MAAEKFADQAGNLGAMRFEGKVSRIQEVDFSIPQVAAVRRGAFRGEDDIVLTPDNQCGRLLRAEPRLKRRIQRQVSPIVVEQVKLNLVVAWAVESQLVECPCVGIEH